MSDESVMKSEQDQTDLDATMSQNKQESDQEMILLQNEMKQLQDELATFKDHYMRLQADFSNALKRKDQEKEQSLKFAMVDFFKEFIFIMDSVDSAIHSLKQPQISSEQTLEGLDMMSRQVIQLIEKFGLKTIEPEVGSAFDPAISEAMSMQPTTDFQHNAVVLVVQRGYALNGRVLRPSRVIVANNPQ